MPRSATTPRKIMIIAMVIGITLLHVISTRYEIFFHLVYRELYFVPIILAGFWFGWHGGLATSLFTSLMYGAFLLWSHQSFTAEMFGGLLDIPLFIAVGVLLGSLRDREAAHQQQLRETAGLTAMGKALSAVAHDMKAPLAAIGGFTHQVRRRLPPDDPAVKKLDLVISQTERLEIMVKDMLSFARPLNLHKQTGDLNRLVEETSELVSEIAEQRNIRLELQLKGRLFCPFDRHRLQQVVLNLLINAVEASPAQEQVVLRTFRNGGEICLEVADRGQGLSREKYDEIFKPFFTTKKEGTGLGLPIAQKIMDAHHGRLEFRNNLEQGTIFSACLPAEEEHQEA